MLAIKLNKNINPRDINSPDLKPSHSRHVNIQSNSLQTCNCTWSSSTFPLPGQWDFGHSLCKLNSIINIGIWVEHIILFAILKVSSHHLKVSTQNLWTMFQVDKIFASVLPIGKYPLLSVSAMTVIVRLSWLVSLLVSLSVNAAFPSSYEPAAVLCIPLLPSGFFFTLLTFLSLIFVSLIVGFSGTFLFLRKASYLESLDWSWY